MLNNQKSDTCDDWIAKFRRRKLSVTLDKEYRFVRSREVPKRD